MAAARRELLKAAEVCEIANVQPYVLRSWEAEFPQLGQPLSGGGPRVYRRSDVELVLRIKALVFGEGLTLAGARRRLDEGAEEPVDVSSLLGTPPAADDDTRARLRQVRDGLRGLLEMLSTDQPPRLVLTAPPPAGRAARARRRSGRELAEAG